MICGSQSIDISLSNMSVVFGLCSLLCALLGFGLSQITETNNDTCCLLPKQNETASEFIAEFGTLQEAQSECKARDQVPAKIFRQEPVLKYGCVVSSQCTIKIRSDCLQNCRSNCVMLVESLSADPVLNSSSVVTKQTKTMSSEVSMQQETMSNNVVMRADRVETVKQSDRITNNRIVQESLKAMNSSRRFRVNSEGLSTVGEKLRRHTLDSPTDTTKSSSKFKEDRQNVIRSLKSKTTCCQINSPRHIPKAISNISTFNEGKAYCIENKFKNMVKLSESQWGCLEENLDDICIAVKCADCSENLNCFTIFRFASISSSRRTKRTKRQKVSKISQISDNIEDVSSNKLMLGIQSSTDSTNRATASTTSSVEKSSRSTSQAQVSKSSGVTGDDSTGSEGISKRTSRLKNTIVRQKTNGEKVSVKKSKKNISLPNAKSLNFSKQVIAEDSMNDTHSGTIIASEREAEKDLTVKGTARGTLLSAITVEKNGTAKIRSVESQSQSEQSESKSRNQSKRGNFKQTTNKTDERKSNVEGAFQESHSNMDNLKSEQNSSGTSTSINVIDPSLGTSFIKEHSSRVDEKQQLQRISGFFNSLDADKRDECLRGCSKNSRIKSNGIFRRSTIKRLERKREGAGASSFAKLTETSPVVHTSANRTRQSTVTNRRTIGRGLNLSEKHDKRTLRDDSISFRDRSISTQLFNNNTEKVSTSFEEDFVTNQLF